MISENAMTSGGEGAAGSWYLKLSRERRRQIDALEEAMERIDAAKHGERGRVYAELEQRFGHLVGWSGKSLGRKYSEWVAAGRRREALRNPNWESKAKTNIDCLHAFKWYCENNQRGSRAAWRQMIADLRFASVKHVGSWQKVWRGIHGATAPMPGACPWDELNVPQGWSYKNLMKRAGLTPFEKTAARIGGGAARDHILPVLTSRVGLKFCQFLQFDDKWHDLDVTFGGPSRGMRPMEFCCYDLLSGSKRAYGMKPRLVDEDTGRRRNLNEKEFRMIVAYVVCLHGFHRDGCTMMTEHGTAAIRAKMQDRLTRLSDGRLSFQQSGIIEAAVHDGMWQGSIGGNFKFKALTEGRHGLDHNELAALPGQRGHDGAVPEQFKHLDHYNEQLALAVLSLPEDMRRQTWMDLQKPLLDYTAYTQIYARVMDALEDRKWHRLQGWAECGFRVTEFRLDEGMPWKNYEEVLAYSPGRRGAVDAMLAERRDFLRVRNMSPREVAAKHSHELTRLPLHLVPDILEREDGFQVTAGHNGLIAFQDQYLGADTQIFHAAVTTPDGFNQALVPGRAYWAHVLPYAADKLFLSDAQTGAILGVAPLYERAPRMNPEAVKRLMGAQNHDAAMKALPMAARHADEAAAKQQLVEHNKAVLAAAEAAANEVPAVVVAAPSAPNWDRPVI